MPFRTVGGDVEGEVRRGILCACRSRSSGVAHQVSGLSAGAIEAAALRRHARSTTGIRVDHPAGQDQRPWPTPMLSADHRLDDKDDQMRQRSMRSRGTPVPMRPVRILIEDPQIDLSESSQLRVWPVDVTVCAGPASDTEECPLVTDGGCPLGRFDVVVGALHGSWAPSVRAAWAEIDTPYADGSGITAQDPTNRLAYHIGAAVQVLYAPYRSEAVDEHHRGVARGVGRLDLPVLPLGD
jgi:hypothetical protein